MDCLHHPSLLSTHHHGEVLEAQAGEKWLLQCGTPSKRHKLEEFFRFLLKQMRTDQEQLCLNNWFLHEPILHWEDFGIEVHNSCNFSTVITLFLLCSNKNYPCLVHMYNVSSLEQNPIFIIILFRALKRDCKNLACLAAANSPVQTWMWTSFSGGTYVLKTSPG